MHIKADRLISTLITGQLNGAALQALLAADADYIAALRYGVLANAPRQDTLLSSPTAITALAGSVLAMGQVWGTPGLPAVVAGNSAWVTALAGSIPQMEQAYATPGAVSALFGADRKLILAPYAAQLTLVSTEVSEWRDASGLGYRVGSTIAGARPSFNGVSLNGNTTLAFDGSNDQLGQFGPLNPFAGGDYTLYLVTRRITGTGDRAVVSDQSGGWIGSNGTAQQSSNNTGSGTTIASGTVTQDAWFLQRLRKLGTNIYGKLNGSAESAAVPSAYPSFAGNLQIGVQNNAKYFAGQIAEIVALGKSAHDNDADNIRITNILRTKYNLF